MWREGLDTAYSVRSTLGLGVGKGLRGKTQGGGAPEPAWRLKGLPMPDGGGWFAIDNARLDLRGGGRGQSAPGPARNRLKVAELARHSQTARSCSIRPSAFLPSAGGGKNSNRQNMKQAVRGAEQAATTTSQLPSQSHY